MSVNDFKTDSVIGAEKTSFKSLKKVIWPAVLLTGLISFSGVIFWAVGFSNEMWNDIGIAAFAQKTLIYISFISVFIALLKIAFASQPFSRTLTFLMNLIGFLFTTSSFVIPRLPGYVSGGFELFSLGAFVLLDGILLTFGLILIILSALLKNAFKTQKESNEIL